MKGANNLTGQVRKPIAEMFDERSEPATALASYLDELLMSATHEAAQEETALPEIQLPDVQIKSPLAQASKATPELILASGGGKPAGKPEWSERPFECLIFKVAGLQLAVPLVLLGAIYRLEDKVVPIPGSPQWYMGMLPGTQGSLRVVDTAQWVMAGRVPAGVRQNYRFVIRLDNSEWALACDEVAQSFTLQPDQVKWRTARSKRPWLAGTVISHMCALIDVSTMASLLRQAETVQHLNLD